MNVEPEVNVSAASAFNERLVMAEVDRHKPTEAETYVELLCLAIAVLYVVVFE